MRYPEQGRSVASCGLFLEASSSSGRALPNHSIGRRLKIAFMLVSLVAIFFLGGCGSYSSETYRYRMTVVVDTPQGPRSGSSVIEIRHSEGPAVPGPEAGGLHTRISGEAVAVDLPGGQILFALLRSPRRSEAAGGYAPSAFAPRLRDIRDVDWQGQIQTLKRLTGQAELPERAYPLLVRFRDPRDPRSIEIVNPRRLEQSFGPGIRMRRILVEMTRDRITRSISEKLPSFGPETGFDDWYRRLPFGDPKQINLSDFQRE